MAQQQAGRWAGRAVLAAGLGGCAAPAGGPGEAAVPWPREDAVALLQDGVVQDVVERVRVARWGAVRWTPGGADWSAAPVLGAASRPGRLLPVVDPGAEVGVLVRTEEARLRVYLDRADLVPTVWDWTRAWSHPDRSGASGHLLVPPGWPLAVEEVGAGAAAVLLAGGPEGAPLLEELWWLGADRLDPVHVPDPQPPAWDEAGPRADWTAVRLADGAWVLDAPGGDALLRWTAAAPAPWSSPWVVGSAENGHLPVIFEDDDHRLGGPELRGWVHGDDVLATLCRGMSWGSSARCGGAGGWRRPRPSHEAPAGSWLRAAPAGEVVGRLTAAVGLDATGADWEPHRLATDWGAVTVWIDAEVLVSTGG